MILPHPRCAALVAALCLAPLAAPIGAQAGALADKAAQIEALLAAGEAAEAVRLARSLMSDVWHGAGLGFTAALLVEPGMGAMGVYNPRDSAEYRIGEPILIYAEPFGFAYGEPQPGVYRIGLTVDLDIYALDGTQLAAIPDLLALEHFARSKVTEFVANITYEFNEAPAGEYVFVSTLRDQNSDRSGSFSHQIRLVE